MSKEMRQKTVNIKRSAYALASTDGENATLTMYGDIYETRPIDWWTGEPIEGDFILLDEFLRDLDEIQRCRSLTIRMNSYGGDANVANVIHNRLREMSRSGMETVCIVDGVAMSGGSLIMIHNCWGYLWGGYNAEQLRELAEQYDAWDKMQASIYARKTGLPEDEILGMMSETTYMTGTEAAAKGFADAIIDDAEPLAIAASQDGRALYIGSRTVHLAPGMTAPESLQKMEDPEAWRERMLAKLRHKEE